MLASKELTSFLLAEDGIEDTSQRLSELIVKIVFCINRNIVLKHKDRIFRSLVVFGAACTFDNDIGDTIAESGGGACVALLHALGELDVGLFGGVIGFGEGFCDDEFGHVDFVLEEVGDGVFDVAGEKGQCGFAGW